MDMSTGIFFWGFLVIYGIVMFILSPKTVSLGGFFRGEDKKGREAAGWMITASIFISWIFAKSVTNPAKTGAEYGILGGIGYAALFAVFFFDLDGKLLFNVVEPFLKNHYDNMERKDMLKTPYDMDKFPDYKYDEA